MTEQKEKKTETEKQEITCNFEVSCEIGVQSITKEQLENWTLEDGLIQLENFTKIYNTARSAYKEFLPQLYIANKRLAKVGNPYKDKNDKVFTWNEYCEKLGVSRGTVNKWLAEYRLKTGIESSKKKTKSKTKDFPTPANEGEKNSTDLDKKEDKNNLPNSNTVENNSFNNLDTENCNTDLPNPDKKEDKKPIISTPDEDLSEDFILEIPMMDSISVTTDDEGNLIIESKCSLCGTINLTRLKNESLLPLILKDKTLLKLILESETAPQLNSKENFHD